MATKNDRIRASNPLAKTPSLAELTGAMVPSEKPSEPRIVEVVPENALVRQPDGTFHYGRFIVNGVGLQAPDDITKDEWMDLGQTFRQLQDVIQWVLGDWLILAEHKWGATYQEVAEHFGYDEKSLRNYKWVASKVHLSLRKDKLRFGHHNLVAGLEPEDQAYWLEQAVQEEWTISQMREAMREKLPTLSDIVSVFQRDLQSFFQKFGKKHDRVGRYKQQFADVLRYMADQIERGDLG